MYSILMVLHIIFGISSFVGSLLLVWGFKEKFYELTTLQKSGIILTVVSLFAITSLLIFSRGNAITAIIFFILSMSISGFIAWKNKPA